MRPTALLLTATLTLTLTAGAPALPRAEQALPPGKWRVEFANGVVERVEVRRDATATVSEPARTSDGKVTPLQGAFLIVCDDDRVERWTPVGNRMVVEHWFPAAQFPAGNPVRGIADVTD
jgi:hypothetical protein